MATNMLFSFYKPIWILWQGNFNKMHLARLRAYVTLIISYNISLNSTYLEHILDHVYYFKYLPLIIIVTCIHHSFKTSTVPTHLLDKEFFLCRKTIMNLTFQHMVHIESMVIILWFLCNVLLFVSNDLSFIYSSATDKIG